MRSPEVTIASIDGLHNNGKTTLIDYVQTELISRDIPAIVRRGDGSRKGTGSSESDPPSLWWREHYPLIAQAGLEGPEAEAAAAMASRQLMTELHDLKTAIFPAELAGNSYGQGFIILDRGPVSRLFVARRYNPDATLEQSLGIDEDPRLAVVIPDSILILHASKEVLLARNQAREPSKRAFNSYIINHYYDVFARVLDNLPPQLAERTTIVDSAAPVETLGSTALSLMGVSVE